MFKVGEWVKVKDLKEYDAWWRYPYKNQIGKVVRICDFNLIKEKGILIQFNQHNISLWKIQWIETLTDEDINKYLINVIEKSMNTIS